MRTTASQAQDGLATMPPAAALAWAARPSASYWSRSWRRFRRNRLAMFSLAVTLLLIAISFGAPLIERYVTGVSYEQQSLLNTFKPPFTPGHILGTDELGRDVLTRLVYGGRVSLSIALIAAGVALTLGTLLGAIAGYYGGWLDSVIMRFVDVLLSIPALFLLILVSTLINNSKVLSAAVRGELGWITLAVVIASIGWTGISRLVRGEVIALKARDFVLAARVVGVDDRRIILRHILPNVVPIMIIWVTLTIPGLILTEAALSYLGFGVQIPTPSWGNMLSRSQQYLYQSVSLIVIPGAMIYLTVLMINLLGNGLRDALDPRLTD
jgi:peptide/nickel transport system permease protein